MQNQQNKVLNGVLPSIDEMFPDYKNTFLNDNMSMVKVIVQAIETDKGIRSKF